jgi:apolipoprotein N-acyltransferase
VIAWLAALAAGVLVAVALPPNGVWPLVLALAIPFALTARAETVRAAFGVGAAFALGFFTLYVAWLPRSFADPGLLGPWFWALHPFLLAILAVMWGLVTALARALGGRGAGALLLLPPYWAVGEALRASGYFAFPWGALGYAWLDTPVAQTADVLGVPGLGVLITTSAALLALPFAPRRPGGFGGAAPRRSSAAGRALGPLLTLALLAGTWVWGGLASGRHDVAAERTALLVQGDVDPFGRAVAAGDDLTVHVELTRLALARMAAPPDLVVWPEGAVTGLPLDGARGAQGRTAVQAAAPSATFVVGGRAVAPGGSANAAFAIADGQPWGRYDKFVLVPFGERWPLLETAPGLYRAVFGLLGLPMLVNTVPGAGPEPLSSPLGPLGVAICYESVFPTVSAAMARAGAEVLVVITNDAWFARGDGARQHLDMGRFRAIETRRWLLRAGNDGITAVVDPYGRVVDELPRGSPGTLAVRYGTSEVVTPFARHADRVPWVLAGLALLVTPVALARRGR